jgi:hypothetical protein
VLGDGWLISGLVFDGAGGFKFFYGNFDAPNGDASFSGVKTGEQGASQGTRYLNVFSDYGCCDLALDPADRQGHGDISQPYDRVESNVFQEMIVDGTTDAGLWSFSFDAKQPSALGCSLSPASTCGAFLRTLDPNAGFSESSRVDFDSTALSNSEWSSHVLDIAIDGSLAGHFLQFGFTSTSEQFDDTGVYYDNINFQVIPVPAAVWLFGSALGLLGFVRRRLTS